MDSLSQVKMPGDGILETKALQPSNPALYVHYACSLRPRQIGAPEECSPLSKTGQTEDKVNLNGSHSPYISALCLPSDLDRTLASVQLGIAFCLTPICCLASLYPQFIFGYLEFSFTPTSQ